MLYLGKKETTLNIAHRQSQVACRLTTKMDSTSEYGITTVQPIMDRSDPKHSPLAEPSGLSFDDEDGLDIRMWHHDTVQPIMDRSIGAHISTSVS